MFHKLKYLFSGKADKALSEIINEDAFLVDVRTPSEFASGNLKGSVNIPVDQIHRQLNKFKDKKNIVVFCRSGMRSSQAQAILKQNGITNVTNGGTWQHVASLLTK